MDGRPELNRTQTALNTQVFVTLTVQRSQPKRQPGEQKVMHR